MSATTPYLNRPLRSEEEATRDCQAAKNMLGTIWAREKPYVDLRAKRAETLRRRLYRHAFCLWRELDRRELDGPPLSEEERGQLMTTLTAIRRALSIPRGQ